MVLAEIGAAIAALLVSHGARFTVLGRTPLADGGDFVQADVADPQAVARAIQSARRKSGAIDILVNNAGQAASAPFGKTDPELWRPWSIGRMPVGM